MRKTRRFRLEVCQVTILGILLSYQTASVFGADTAAKSSSLPITTPDKNNARRPTRKTVNTRAAKPAKVAEGKPTLAAPSTDQVVSLLKENMARQEALLAAQQEQIAQLRASLDEQKQRLDSAAQSPPRSAEQAPSMGQVASLSPVVAGGVVAKGNAAANEVPAALRTPGAMSVTQEEIKGYTRRVDQLSKSVEGTAKNLAGFRFSGDLRLRSDTTIRSSNKFAGPAQNVRGNYRMRFNVDKALNDQFGFHLQVASGAFNNQLTYNSDFGGFAVRGPIFIGEAWASYHPNPNIELRGGRIPEVFADDSRFLFKEDIRFTGLQQTFNVLFGPNPLGISRVELSGGEYVLTNPNVQVLPSAKACTPAPAQVITMLPATITTPAALPASCAYLNAGYLPGQKVRDAALFHPGFAIFGDLKTGWHHQFQADLQLYRNQNQIALAATAAGAPLVTGATYGFSSILPIPGTGTATTTAGGAMFTAPNFQVAHAKYRIGYDGWKIKDHEMPAYLEFHAARNVGTGFLNNAVMGLANFGEVKKAGDVRLLYAYSIKGGNSMISEVTDDYLGTNTGVNFRTHEIRIDLGLTRFLVWQNLFFIQNEISGNDPARHFFVPLPAGAATQYRLQSQLQFKF